MTELMRALIVSAADEGTRGCCACRPGSGCPSSGGLGCQIAEQALAAGRRAARRQKRAAAFGRLDVGVNLVNAGGARVRATACGQRTRLKPDRGASNCATATRVPALAGFSRESQEKAIRYQEADATRPVGIFSVMPRAIRKARTASFTFRSSRSAPTAGPMRHLSLITKGAA
jgi:hypothetical protein